MKNKQIILILVGLILLVSVITNPNQDRHKEVVKNKLNVLMQNAMKESLENSNNGTQQFGSALGLMLGGVMLDRMIENMVSSDNYVLFSTTKITWEGETKLIGVGLFGNVFISSEIDEALKGKKGLIPKN
jgi:hypothetical protein